MRVWPTLTPPPPHTIRVLMATIIFWRWKCWTKWLCVLDSGLRSTDTWTNHILFTSRGLYAFCTHNVEKSAKCLVKKAQNIMNTNMNMKNTQNMTCCVAMQLIVLFTLCGPHNWNQLKSLTYYKLCQKTGNIWLVQ